MFTLIGFLIELYIFVQTHQNGEFILLDRNYAILESHISESYIVSFFNNFDYLLPLLVDIILHTSIHLTLIKHTQIDVMIVIILKMRKWG